jgi:glycosyltransferase involved in cell wall biosynthesis
MTTQPEVPIHVVACPGASARNNNPYTFLTHAPMAALGHLVHEFSFYRPLPREARVLHVHWPECIFWGRAPALHPLVAKIFARRLLAAMDGVRGRGGIAVWTAHNIVPHEPLPAAQERIWRNYFTEFRRRVDLIINLSTWAEVLLLEVYPDLAAKRRVVLPHPHYRSSYPPPPPRPEARRRHGFADGTFVLLAAGTVRPSKGIAELAEAFTRVARPDERLRIEGACENAQLQTRLRAISSLDARVELRDRRIDDAEIAGLVSAADLSVFNFTQILNSGSALLAASFGSPVCAPEIASLKELAGELGSDWFFALPSPLTDEGLRQAIDRSRACVLPRQAGPALGNRDPGAIARRLGTEYARALAARQEAETTRSRRWTTAFGNASR